MITTILIISLLLVMYFYMKPRIVTKDKHGNDTFDLKPGTIPTLIIIFIGGSIAIFVQPFKIERVDAGCVGIKVNLVGDDRGISKFEYKTGFVVINTWFNKLYEFPVSQQHKNYEAQQVITKGGFPAIIKPSFNYALKPTQVGNMFQYLRKDIQTLENEWLFTAIVGAMNDVTNRWAVDDIFNYREKFEAEIILEANKRVNRWFIISQLRTNIVPPEALQQSIIAKTQSLQKVQVAENNQKVAFAEAAEKIAVAKGDSAEAVILAAGKAEAIRKEQLYLTPMYNEYLKIQKWDGSNSQVVAGNGSGLLINVK